MSWLEAVSMMILLEAPKPTGGNPSKQDTLTTNFESQISFKSQQGNYIRGKEIWLAGRLVTKACRLSMPPTLPTLSTRTNLLHQTLSTQIYFARRAPQKPRAPNPARRLFPEASSLGRGAHQQSRVIILDRQLWVLPCRRLKL